MSQTINERRQQTSKIVQELLEERQRVWSLYCDIGSLKPFPDEKALAARMQEFCQLLIDYISLGHFGIYQRITDGSERRRKVLDMAEQIYPQIAEATDAAIEFNDKYETLAGKTIGENLADDLSKLGEELAKRIELEDQLINSMVS